MLFETAGFGGPVEKLAFSDSLLHLLPATCDRFLEARFFAREAISLEPREALFNEANWFISAHMAAVIGIRDAAKHDFERAGKATAFDDSAIAKEFYLRSDAPMAADRDPLAVNKAYRDLRNLRVHRAIPLVVMESKTLGYDLHRDTISLDAPMRWFMRPIDVLEHRLLRNPQLSPNEITRFNNWLGERTLGEVVYQHLLVLSKVIEETGPVLV